MSHQVSAHESLLASTNEMRFSGMNTTMNHPRQFLPFVVQHREITHHLQNGRRLTFQERLTAWMRTLTNSCRYFISHTISPMLTALTFQARRYLYDRMALKMVLAVTFVLTFLWVIASLVLDPSQIQTGSGQNMQTIVSDREQQILVNKYRKLERSSLSWSIDLGDKLNLSNPDGTWYMADVIEIQRRAKRCVVKYDAGCLWSCFWSCTKPVRFASNTILNIYKPLLPPQDGNAPSIPALPSIPARPTKPSRPTQDETDNKPSNHIIPSDDTKPSASTRKPSSPSSSSQSSSSSSSRRRGSARSKPSVKPKPNDRELDAWKNGVEQSLKNTGDSVRQLETEVKSAKNDISDLKTVIETRQKETTDFVGGKFDELKTTFEKLMQEQRDEFEKLRRLDMVVDPSGNGSNTGTTHVVDATVVDRVAEIVSEHVTKNLTAITDEMKESIESALRQEISVLQSEIKEIRESQQNLTAAHTSHLEDHASRPSADDIVRPPSVDPQQVEMQNVHIQQINASIHRTQQHVPQIVSEKITSIIDADFSGDIDWAQSVVSHSKLTGLSIGQSLTFFIWTGIFGKYSQHAVRPSLRTGECTPLAGMPSHVIVKLYKPIIVTKLSLYHFTNIVTPTHESAPREFRIGGSNDLKSWFPIGEYEYQIQKSPLQFFSAKNNTGNVSRYVIFRVMSNWGGPYTCLYRIRVYGYEPRFSENVDEVVDEGSL